MGCFGYGDSVYLLTSNDRTSEKFDIFIHSMENQAIIFTPHLSTIYYEVKRLRGMDIDAVAYTSNIDYYKRDRIRERFDDGEFQFLYATPRMYFMNDFFRDFVDEQVLSGNLGAIVFDNAKYLFEYGNDTDKYESYQNISNLKCLAPEQQWIVIADADCIDNIDNIAKVLYLESPKLMRIQYFRNIVNHKLIRYL